MNSKRKILIFALALTAVFVFSVKSTSAIYNTIYDGFPNEKTCSPSGSCIIGGGGDVCTTSADCAPPGPTGPTNGQLITQSLPAFSCQTPYTNSDYCGYPNGVCNASFASAGSGYGWSVSANGTSVDFNPSPSAQALNMTLISVSVDDAGSGTGWSHTGCTCGCQDQTGSNCATTFYPNTVWNNPSGSFPIWGSAINWCVPNGWGVWGGMNASYQVQSLVCNPGYVVSGSSCVPATGTLQVQSNLKGVNFTVVGPGGVSYSDQTALNKNKSGYFAAIVSYVYAATYSWAEANAGVGQYAITSNDPSKTVLESGNYITYNFDRSNSNTSTIVPFNGTGTITLNYTASPPTATLSASPSSITQGQSSTLTWSSTNATSCSGSWTTSTNTSGTNSVTPSQTTTYTITCTGPGGNASASATVSVTPSTPTCPTGQTNPYFTCQNNTCSQVNACGASTGGCITTGGSCGTIAPTANLSASPLSITQGQSSTLTWSSTNATSCSGSWTSSALGTSGSQSVSPSQTTTYTITCTGPGGNASASATVSVAAAAAWANLSITDGNFYVGDSWTLTLTSNQPNQSLTSCAILPNGTKSCTPNSGTTDNQGSWSKTGTFTSDTVGSWTEWATVGQATSNQISFTVTNPPANAPTASLSASPSSITQGQSSTLTWSSTNATSCSGSWTTSTNTSGTNSVTPSQTTTYTITCTGPGGNASASAKVTVTAITPTCPSGQTNPYSTCLSNACVSVSGCGVSSCTSNPDCVVPSCPAGQTNPYKICQNNACTQVSGCGVSSCSSNITCAPTISLSPTSVSYSAVFGSSAPNESTQSVTITNSGASGSTLNWQASSNKNWLSLSKNSGSLSKGQSDSFALLVNPQSLAPGTYLATVTVTAPNATNSPKTVSVKLVVYDCSSRSQITSVGPISCSFPDGKSASNCVSGTNLGGINLSAGFTASQAQSGEITNYTCTWTVNSSTGQVASYNDTKTCLANSSSLSVYSWNTIGQYTAQFNVQEVSTLNNQVCVSSSTAQKVFSVLPSYQEAFLNKIIISLTNFFSNLFALVK